MDAKLTDETNWLMCVRRPLQLFVFAVCAFSLPCLADYTTWIGGDGNWGDETKWSKGIPSSDTPGQIFFETTGEPYTVTLDRDVTCTMLLVKTPESGIGTATVTLAGAGTITCVNASGNAMDIQTRASFVLDGPTIQFQETSATTFISGDFEMKSGMFTQGTCIYITGSNTHFKVSGGYISSPRLKLSERPLASYEQTGGYAAFNSFETTSSNPITITGGTIRRSSLTVPAGTADFRGVTNVVNRLLFTGSTSLAGIANYCGPFVAMGQDVDPGTWAAYVGFPLGITFGSIANWKIDRSPTLNLRERFHLDTSDFFDASVARTINISVAMTFPTPFDFAVYGGGTLNYRPGGTTLPSRLNAFTLGDNTTMTMVRLDETYHRNNKLAAQRLKLGAGSNLTLMMKYNYLESTDAAEIGDGAVLNMHVYGSDSPYTDTYGDKRYLAMCAGATGSVEKLTVNVTGDGAAGWSVRKLLNCAWIDDGQTDMTPDSSDSTEWCGGSGGNFSTAANWSKGSAPASLVNGNYSVKFKTMQGVVTNDVDNANMLLIHVKASCGPLTMRGKPISARQAYSRSSVSAIRHYGKFPLVFENDVSAPATCANFNVIGGDTAPTYIAFMGKLTVLAPVFDVCGHVVIGGEATANSLWMNTTLGSAKATMLEVLNGGSMTVSSQSNAFDKASSTSLRVNEGGVMSFTGGTFDNRTASKHRVYGLMDIDVPLSSTAALSFAGSGRVYVGSTKSSATATSVKISEGLRLCPKSWATLTTDGVAPITIYAETRATIGAKADWTYGPAAGVSTETTAAERALVTEGLYAPLTIDTTDPDTGVGHTIMFADPILAAGDVEVKGCGAVCFASGEDSFGCNLSFDPTVELKLSPSQRVAALSGWAPVITAAKIEGTPMIEEGVRVRVADNGDGTQSIECFVKSGMRIVIR